MVTGHINLDCNLIGTAFPVSSGLFVINIAQEKPPDVSSGGSFASGNAACRICMLLCIQYADVLTQ